MESRRLKAGFRYLRKGSGTKGEQGKPNKDSDLVNRRMTLVRRLISNSMIGILWNSHNQGSGLGRDPFRAHYCMNNCDNT